MSSRQASAGALAKAIAGAAVTAGATTPAVRGADWRLGIVTAINATAGTVDVGDIRARRMESYQSPAIGDQIVITLNSAGNWAAWGRTSGGGDTAWTTPTLASGYTHDGNSNGTLQYRIRYAGGTKYIEFRGGVSVPGSVGTGSSTIFTLPVGARPTVRRSVAAAKNAEGYKVDINTTGAVSVVSGVAVAWSWVALNGIYSLD